MWASLCAHFFPGYFTGEIFEDTKEVTRSRDSKKDKQYNVQMKNDNKTNHCPQNPTKKTKAWAKPTPWRTDVKLKCSRRVGSSCSASANRRVNLVKTVLDPELLLMWTFPCFYTSGESYIIMPEPVVHNESWRSFVISLLQYTYLETTRIIIEDGQAVITNWAIITQVLSRYLDTFTGEEGTAAITQVSKVEFS